MKSVLATDATPCRNYGGWPALDLHAGRTLPPVDAETWNVVEALGTWAAVVVALWVSVGESIRRGRERRDADRGQARLVAIEGDGSGGIWVIVTNHSSEPIFGPELEDVRWAGPERSEIARWEVAPAVIGARQVQNMLNAGAEWRIPIIFLDHDGKRKAVGVGSFRATISFRDARGLEWRRVASQQPERVLPKSLVHRLLRRG